MKCKSKNGGHFRLNDKGKWVKVEAPVQGELPFSKNPHITLCDPADFKGIPFIDNDGNVEFGM